MPIFSQAQVFISLHCVVQKSYCAMGQRLLQRPSYGCLYKGGASSARRHSRSPSAAHQASPPSPAVTGRRGRGAYDAPSRRATARSAARVECARKAAAPAAPATTASPLLSWAVPLAIALFFAFSISETVVEASLRESERNPSPPA